MEINLSFNELLKDALTKDALLKDALLKDANIVERCLISNEPLNSNKITLICKHSFNYKPLFNEIKIQKTRFNNLETQRLNKTQIKCPYCRNTQNGILPYKDGCAKVKYVNWPPKHTYKPFKCEYSFLSGKKKNEKCNRSSCSKFCKQHNGIMINRQAKQNKKINVKINVKINEKINEKINVKINEKIKQPTTLFLKCKLDYKHWIKQNICPTIKHTKNYSYFRCRCQHIINKENGKQCSKYMVCSNKLSKNNKISPIFYRRYLCNTHNHKNEEVKKNNIINFPKNINIDLLNIPDNHTFNTYLSKYYNTFFNSTNYTYHKFKGFVKKEKHFQHPIMLI